MKIVRSKKKRFVFVYFAVRGRIIMDLDFGQGFVIFVTFIWRSGLEFQFFFTGFKNSKFSKKKLWYLWETVSGVNCYVVLEEIKFSKSVYFRVFSCLIPDL